MNPLQYYYEVSLPTSLAFGTRRRTELFDALIDLFLSEGFAHLTLDDIAARLRCSKSTLYTLAGSKEQLVRAAIRVFCSYTSRAGMKASRSAMN